MSSSLSNREESQVAALQETARRHQQVERRKRWFQYQGVLMASSLTDWEGIEGTCTVKSWGRARQRHEKIKCRNLTCSTSTSGHFSVVPTPKEYTKADDTSAKDSPLQRETGIGEWSLQRFEGVPAININLIYQSNSRKEGERCSSFLSALQVAASPYNN